MDELDDILASIHQRRRSTGTDNSQELKMRENASSLVEHLLGVRVAPEHWHPRQYTRYLDTAIRFLGFNLMISWEATIWDGQLERTDWLEVKGKRRVTNELAIKTDWHRFCSKEELVELLATKVIDGVPRMARKALERRI